MGADEPSLDFRCSHCEKTEESFSSLKRPEDDLFKITVRNIPRGFTYVGITNLFLTVGKPLFCTYSPGWSHATVVFKSMNEAELAYRDLHNKPPYHLKIIRNYHHFGSDANQSGADVNSKDFKAWDFSVQEAPVDESKVEDDTDKLNKVIIQVKSILGSLGYDPSIRMRQKMLDFKTGSNCVSKGRGYVNIGKEDRFVGGLQKFVFSSTNGKAKDTMVFQCENCESSTTKVCANCHASYCSLSCLRESSADHLGCSSPPGVEEVKDAAVSNVTSSAGSRDATGTVSVKESFPEVTFPSGCTVIMTFFSSMRTVFLRRTDGGWEDRFAKLCNEVALHGIKGESLQDTPEEGDVVAARYHEDLCFHRGRVLSKTDTKISVLFIDFGNTQETFLEDLRSLPDHLRSIPGQALQVLLKDVPEDSSLDSVEYLNTLTARRVPLTMKTDTSGQEEVVQEEVVLKEVVLVEKDSNLEVNRTLMEKALPSWKRDGFSFSKLGENFFLKSMRRTTLEVSKTCSLIVSHFAEKEFLDCEVFWVTQPDTPEYLHVRTRMRQAMMEYCALLKDDYYLPRVNELCLARENDEWHRCVNLKNQKTTCFLFFVDDGHSSYIETKDIRKMIQDFTEAPIQAVCCVLPSDPRLTTDSEIRSKALQYLKDSVGRRIDSVTVLKLVGDAYALSFPRIADILASEPKP